MKHSTHRILTTHVGSLPRPPDLLAMTVAKEKGAPFDAERYVSRVKSAVAEVVKKQAEAGIDVVADGEMGRFGFIPYVNDRLAGIEPRPNPGGEGTWSRSREHLAFPEYYAWAAQMPGAAGGAQATRWVCTGPIAYKGHKALARDIANLKAALAAVNCEEAFMPAVSPAQLAGWNNPELDITQCRYVANATVEVLNHALAGIPPERVRYHTCYGINMGPRVHELEMKHIVDIMLRINTGAYSFEAGNPRHEHEWRVWEEVKLPAGKALIPGVITHGSNFVEHPEAIAQRIGRFAKVVGRENVIAGADCGFASFSTTCEVHPTVVWVKLAALAEGARLATKELWGRA